VPTTENMKPGLPEPIPARDTTVDLVVVGSGTGMAAALAAHEAGLSVLIVEKTELVGGSTARSGGAFWIPASKLLAAEGMSDSKERAEAYVRAAVDGSSPEPRWQSFLRHGDEAIALLQRRTPLKFIWTRGYSDYHPDLPGGAAIGRTCEAKPFDVNSLGSDRSRLRPSDLTPPLPMPTTGADYKWMNLVVRMPAKGIPVMLKRLALGIGGRLIGRDYVTAGQALAAGMYAGVRKSGIPVWTKTELVELVTEGPANEGRVTGVVLEQDGRRVTVTAHRGVVLAAGGFDHNMEWRQKFQSEALQPGWSVGSEGNFGDGIRLAQEIGADVTLMDQAWWFPEIAPVAGGAPPMLLADRSLPGSFIIDDSGRRFVNESTDYMSFGQRVLDRERAGDPVGSMWIIFDQTYRNSYVMGGVAYPRMPLPKAWYDAGIAHRATDPAVLAKAIGVPAKALTQTLHRFNSLAAAGVDDDFNRGATAYDRYYGDPTVQPNPNLRPLAGTTLYAVKVVLGDLGTCGGLRADEAARVLREDGSPIDGLYAIGNTAGNVFGMTYPGAGATLAQGIVFGVIAARHAAGPAGAVDRPKLTTA